MALNPRVRELADELAEPATGGGAIIVLTTREPSGHDVEACVNTTGGALIAAIVTLIDVAISYTAESPDTRVVLMTARTMLATLAKPPASGRPH